MENRITYKRFIAVFALMFVLCGGRFLYAADGWEASLIASAGVAENRLFFGQKIDAAEGIDGKYDASAMLGGDIKASFKNSDSALWRDIKAIGGQKSWTMNIESDLQDKDIILKWDAGIFPDGYKVTLIDRTAGQSVDMTSGGSYTYKNTGPRELFIMSDAPASVSQTEEIHQAADKDFTETEISADDTGAAQGETTEKAVVDTSVGGAAQGLTLTYVYGTRADDDPALSDDFKKGDLSIEELGYDDAFYADSGAYLEEKSYSYKKEDLSQLQYPALIAPSGLDGWLAQGRGIYLKWEDFSAGEHGFIVERKRDKENDWEIIAVVWIGKSSYYDHTRDITKGSIYFYRVMTIDGRSESGYSNAAAFNHEGKIKDTGSQEEKYPRKEKKIEVSVSR